MYKTILSTLLLLMTSACLSAQTILSKDAQALQQTVTRFFDALAAKDSIGLKNYSTSDIILYENGKIWNMDSLILHAITVNADPAFKRSNRFNFLNTSVRKNVGWVSYDLFSEVSLTNKKTSIQWQETVVLVKEKKQWKIKVLHSALIKRITK